jgi:membrane protein implicated in regulation of membrane protease activity
VSLSSCTFPGVVFLGLDLIGHIVGGLGQFFVTNLPNTSIKVAVISFAISQVVLIVFLKLLIIRRVI